MFKGSMKYCRICFFLLLIAINGISQNAQQVSLSKRTKECFDFSWQFHKGDIAIKRAVKAAGYGGLTDINVKVETNKEAVIAYADVDKAATFKPGDWREVNLPHDWCVEGTFVNDKSIGSAPAVSGYLPGGIGFYRKEFEIPEGDKGKKISIEFDGIFRNSTVWVNGQLIGNHQSGYTPSNYDLTDVLRYGSEGKNVVLIKGDATEYEGWWYEGCGIYRHVWLNKTDRLHVDRFGTYVTTPSVSPNEAVVSVKTNIKNEYSVVKNITLTSKIVDNKGAVLDTKTSSEAIEPFSTTEISQKGAIQK
ncbi:MAG: sugar-binding domain-containing protein, partial [Bacteroidia bacterium]